MAGNPLLLELLKTKTGRHCLSPNFGNSTGLNSLGGVDLVDPEEDLKAAALAVALRIKSRGILSRHKEETSKICADGFRRRKKSLKSTVFAHPSS
jgi:hypothetical protein